MKRILHVISTLEQGGTEAVVLNYLANMDADKIIFDFLVIWGEKKGYYEDFLLSKGCKIFKMQNPPNKFFAHGSELRQFFKREKYDIVHIHAMSALRYRVAKAAKMNGVKTVIYHSHNSSNDNHLFIHKALKSRLNRWCDYRFACSSLAGNYMYSGRFTVINNAIDIGRFSFDAECRVDLRKKYNLRNKLVIGNIGRLAEVKNQQFLLQLIPYIKEIEKDFVFVVIGEGGLRDKLQDYVNGNGLNDYVVFTGNVGTEVYKYYSVFDVLAFPSLFEGLSVVLMEAQANGLPIVASDRITAENGITEYFKFLPIDETEANFKSWAETILSFKDKRQDNANAVASAGFDIKTEAKKLQEFYLSF